MSTFSPTISGATITVDPFAFARSGEMPDLGTIGVTVGGKMLRYGDLSDDDALSAAFVGVADLVLDGLGRGLRDPLDDDERARNVCAEFVREFSAHELRAAEAATATQTQAAPAKERLAARVATIPGRIPSDSMSRDVYVRMMSERRWSQENNQLVSACERGTMSYSSANFLASLGPQKALIYAAVIGAWLQAHAQKNLDSDGDALLSVNALLEMMGRKKHVNGGYKIEQKQWVRDTLLSLAGVYVDGQYRLPSGKMAEIKGPLVKVEFGTGRAGLSAYDFYVQPGKSAKQYLTQTRQTAVFFDRVAKLDIRSAVARIALHIALYLAPQYRIREAHGTLRQPIRIETILRGAGLPDSAHTRHILDFRTEIEDALDILEDRGGIEFWDYVPGEIEALPEANWFPQWLQCHIVPEPPAEVLEEAENRAAALKRRVENAKRAASRRALRDARKVGKLT